jgi:hypothetical protein
LVPAAAYILQKADAVATGKSAWRFKVNRWQTLGDLLVGPVYDCRRFPAASGSTIAGQSPLGLEPAHALHVC